MLKLSSIRKFKMGNSGSSSSLQKGQSVQNNQTYEKAVLRQSTNSGSSSSLQKGQSVQNNQTYEKAVLRQSTSYNATSSKQSMGGMSNAASRQNIMKNIEERKNKIEASLNVSKDSASNTANMIREKYVASKKGSALSSNSSNLYRAGMSNTATRQNIMSNIKGNKNKLEDALKNSNLNNSSRSYNSGPTRYTDSGLEQRILTAKESTTNKSNMVKDRYVSLLQSQLNSKNSKKK